MRPAVVHSHPRTAKIVFKSIRDGVGSIYVMDDDGSEDAEAQGRTDLPALTGGDPCGWRPESTHRVDAIWQSNGSGLEY